MLLTMEMYADDCGEGAEGAGEPHIGEILGAGVSRTVGAPWRVRAGMCPRVLLRPGEMDCSALLLSVVCFEFCYATTSPVRHSRDTPPPRALVYSTGTCDIPIVCLSFWYYPALVR
jgi:hypothetical protein